MNLIDFADEEACFRALVALLHSTGLRCPHCGAENGLHVFRNHSKSWIVDHRCSCCRSIFNVWTGTPFQRTHHPPSELWRIIRAMIEGRATAQLALDLHCQRGPLARFRRRLQPWVIQNFGPLPKKSAKKCAPVKTLIQSDFPA